jgi:hypothetical protein
VSDVPLSLLLLDKVRLAVGIDLCRSSLKSDDEQIPLMLEICWVLAKHEFPPACQENPVGDPDSGISSTGIVRVCDKDPQAECCGFATQFHSILLVPYWLHVQNTLP